MTHCLVFISPAGTTRQIVTSLADRLEERQQKVLSFDLAVPVSGKDWQHIYRNWPEQACLWIASPVYCDHALPIIEQFIRGLPESEAGYAVPLATWGGVTSGLALPEMASQLNEKGYRPVAAGKFMAVHSSTWSAVKPHALGHPDAADLKLACELVDQVLDLLEKKPVPRLSRGTLDYLPVALKKEADKISLARVKAAMPPLKVDHALCTRCGVCAAGCPMGCIELAPYPVVGEDCIRCVQCVRQCPEDAFFYQAEATHARIEEMAHNSAEEKISHLFLPQ